MAHYVADSPMKVAKGVKCPSKDGGAPGNYNGNPQWGPPMSKGPAGASVIFFVDAKPAKSLRVDSPMASTTLKNPKRKG